MLFFSNKKTKGVLTHQVSMVFVLQKRWTFPTWNFPPFRHVFVLLTLWHLPDVFPGNIYVDSDELNWDFQCAALTHPVDGRNPANHQLRLVVDPMFFVGFYTSQVVLLGFIHPRWLAGYLPSTVGPSMWFSCQVFFFMVTWPSLNGGIAMLKHPENLQLKTKWLFQNTIFLGVHVSFLGV